MAKASSARVVAPPGSETTTSRARTSTTSAGPRYSSAAFIGRCASRVAVSIMVSSSPFLRGLPRHPAFGFQAALIRPLGAGRAGARPQSALIAQGVEVGEAQVGAGEVGALHVRVREI